MLNYESRNTYIVITGIRRRGPDRFSCTVSIVNQNTLQQNEPEIITDPGISYLTDHRATLLCLLKYLNVIKTTTGNKKHITIIFITPVDSIRFEWMVEYKEDKSFSKQTADQDIWDKITEYIKEENIRLFIKANDSILSGVASSYGRWL